jgi:hypothetical protein
VTPLHSWQDRQRLHLQRADRLVADHENRQRRGEAHPVEDFLFTYYAYRPNQLRRWHPGVGHSIPTTDVPHRRWPHYRVSDDGMVGIDVAEIAERRGVLLHTVRRLLRATLQRDVMTGCFGMHEWAMVYQIAADDVRHHGWPLRFDPDRIADIVSARELRCTHFDAFRFFTEPAKPLNRVALTREQQADHEQPGCLHAGMDLYKWAYKLTPAVPSELVLDAFELARDIRYVDMRASPYDLSALGLAPIAVETSAGRADYARHQRAFAHRAAPLRRQLLEVCEQLTAVTAGPR